ncbi:hypothetical protein MUK42_36026 [Musa troglodytarum]|uniref:Uncharacterized protein n=1 Tax=Musa troglodytarum TaxID=320322 RepID=A0A9E7L136_9LILI|nr:hypothetical protein MUK42_36026 [Musa troglodytarum]
MDTLLGIPFPVIPSSLLGKSKVKGILAGPLRFFRLGSAFFSLISSSIDFNAFPNRWNASSAFWSVVHSGVSRWAKYTSSDAWVDRISSSETPMMVWY